MVLKLKEISVFVILLLLSKIFEYFFVLCLFLNVMMFYLTDNLVSGKNTQQSLPYFIFTNRRN